MILTSDLMKKKQSYTTVVAPERQHFFWGKINFFLEDYYYDGWNFLARGSRELRNIYILDYGMKPWRFNGTS